MGPKGLTFPRLSLSNCERDRSDEPVRILYSAEPSVGSKRAIGCSNILSFGKPLEGLKAGNRRSNNRTIYVRMRLIIYLFIYLFINDADMRRQDESRLPGFAEHKGYILYSEVTYSPSPNP